MGLTHRQTWAGRIFLAMLLGTMVLAIAAGPALAASGDQLWARRYNAYSGRDEAVTDMAVDASGNIYVCGWADKGSGSTIDYDLLLVKYSPAGVKLWSVDYLDPPGAFVMGYALAIDGLGNVFVAGTYDGDGYGAASVESLQVIKFSSAGAFVIGSVRNYGAFHGGVWYPCGGADVAIDPSTNDVIVTGYAQTGAASARSIWTVRGNNNLGWFTEDVYAGPSATDLDRGTALKVAPSGDYYVCGTSSSGTDRDWATLKYSSGGARTWVRRLDGTSHDIDEPTGLGVDSSNNVYVCGVTHNVGRGFDATVARYTPTGGLNWIRKHDGAAHGEDHAGAIAVNGARGMVVITGFQSVGGGTMNVLTQRYSMAGGLLWSRQYDGPHHRQDVGHSAWIGPGGNVYVAGETVYTTTGADYLTLKYSPTGAFRWFRRYNKSSTEGDMARKVIANSGGCYVSGISYSGVGDENEDIATLKYVP